MTLDKGQQKFVKEVLEGKGHIILTGKAGTGKSTALAAAVHAAKQAGKDVSLMAPTAMAASIHRDAGLESGTIHHALRWNPVREPLARKLMSVIPCTIDLEAAPDQDRLLVIDEGSMVGLWLFEILMRDLGDGKPNGRPFDGRRLVVVGDWAQLPPVVTTHEEQSAKGFEQFGAPGDCLMYHPLFTHQPPVAIVLEESHRANSAWYNSLNDLRNCNFNYPLAAFGIIPQVHGDDMSDEVTHMCFMRKTAHTRNERTIARLSGRVYGIRLMDGDIEMRSGCRVIVTSNRAHEEYINGSRADFSHIEGGWLYLDDGNEIGMLADGNWGTILNLDYKGRSSESVDNGMYKANSILRMYSKTLEKDAVAWLQKIAGGKSASQAAMFADGYVTLRPYYPILPGYALTVHKAQGMTLDSIHVEVDVFHSFAPPRLPYVALSRVRDGNDVTMAVPAHTVMVRPDHDYAGIMGKLEKWRVKV